MPLKSGIETILNRKFINFSFKAQNSQRYDFPHLRIPVTTLISPLCFFETSLFKYISLRISILLHLITY